MEITNPEQLIEKGTDYNFLKFWNDFTMYDKEDINDDGGCVVNWGTTKTLKGLCQVAKHYKMHRDNSFYQVEVPDLVKYVSKHDKVFAKRIKKVKDLPNILVDDWIERVLDGDKKLRKQLGLS